MAVSSVFADNGALVRRLLLGLCCLLAFPFLAGAAGAGQTAAPGTGASASATAIRVVVPGAGGAVSASVSAPPNRVAFGGGFAYPDAAGVTAGSHTASASADAGDAATATASSEVSGLSLFGGEVSVASVSARATASARNGEATGSLSGSAVSGFTVGGAGADASPGARVALGDWGYAVVLAQGTQPTEHGFRGYVVALEIQLTADHGGLPAGTQIQVGLAEAAATAPPAPKPIAPPPARKEPPKQAPRAAKVPKGKPPEVTRPRKGRVPPLVRQIPDIQPKLGPNRYVFPVFGPVAFGNTFGAPRANVDWHHGEDIFAPLGAPVLAVTRGTVYSVGWNDIGGNRLWLRDAQGNEFYYAHLSAFSPLAVNGAHVKAGDVLGFVGTSGDAEGTPPHLHFEIHPVGLLGLGYDGAVEPYGYLVKMLRLQEVHFAAAAGWAPQPAAASAAPRPGAVLLYAADISTANGLDPASLARALEAPRTSHTDEAPARPARLLQRDRVR